MIIPLTLVDDKEFFTDQTEQVIEIPINRINKDGSSCVTVNDRGVVTLKVDEELFWSIASEILKTRWFKVPKSKFDDISFQLTRRQGGK